MIVDDAAGLEMSIHRHRAHVLEAVGLEPLGDQVGQAVADGDLSLFVADIQDGFAPGMGPRPIAKAAVLPPDFLEAPGVVDHRFDLPAGADHAVNVQDALHVIFGVGGDFVIIKAVKACAEDLSLLEHQAPRKAALHGLHHQMLKHHPVVVHRHAPFGVVVGFHGFKGEAPMGSLSNNVNQIARRLNERGSIFETEIDDIKDRQEELRTILSSILHRLDQIHH